MPVIDNMMLAAPDQPGEKLRIGAKIAAASAGRSAAGSINAASCSATAWAEPGLALGFFASKLTAICSTGCGTPSEANERTGSFTCRANFS